MTTAPCFTQNPRTSAGDPAAATTISAWRAISGAPVGLRAADHPAQVSLDELFDPAMQALN
ncbi:hypothetical protein FHW94_001666 [Novosphingobium sp. SG720]|nr:hypothetical protein [Novosphingobium sp. SG720]